jgi:hypothetical protein
MSNPNMPKTAAVLARKERERNTRIANLADAENEVKRNGAQMVTKLTERFMESVEKYGLAYGLSWADDPAMHLATATFWAQVERIHFVNGVELAEAMDAVRSEVTRQLVENQLRGGSTSQFTNAWTAAEREGASRFLRDSAHVAKLLTAND